MFRNSFHYAFWKWVVCVLGVKDYDGNKPDQSSLYCDSLWDTDDDVHERID